MYPSPIDSFERESTSTGAITVLVAMTDLQGREILSLGAY